jgi:sugar phosphate isomerase/epimerase
MVRGGLSSVSYRNASPEAVIAAAKAAGLGGIEWTADTHVPHGDLRCAEKVMMATLRAGLTISAYGSFFRLGIPGQDATAFGPVLETALRLQAPVIRIWGGTPRGSRPPSPEELAAEGAAVADLAGRHGITLCIEPHERSAVPGFAVLARLLDAAGHPFLGACWTHLPGNGAGTEGEEEIARLAELIGPRISLVHIRNWSPFRGADRAAGDGCCAAAIERMVEHNRASALDRWALIEYLEDDKPETLKRDAEALAARLGAARG